MNEIIFNTKEYTSKNETYKDFYRDIVKKLNNFIDFEGDKDLGFDADILNEFMWYNHDKNLQIIFVGLDLEKIKKQKTTDDYKWHLIIDIMSDFVKEYPNNTLEFRDE